MAHKSHRQKALQAQLETQPAVSLVSSSKKAPLPKPTASSSTLHHPVASSSTNDADADDVEMDDEVLIASSSAPASAQAGSSTAGASSSGFAPLSGKESSGVLKNEFRRITIPPHRMSPLKRDWVNLYTPMVDMLGLQVRMNVKRRAVEIKVSSQASASIVFGW